MDEPAGMKIDVHQKERELYLDLRKLQKWTRGWCVEEDVSIPMLQEAEELKTYLQEQMRDVSAIIFETMKQQYQFSESFTDVITKYGQYSYHAGIAKTLHKKGIIQKRFRQLLLEKMPKHAKDEYREARTLQRMFYLHIGPTNSGKTYTALRALKRARTGVYVAPLRLLALEVYEQVTSSRFAG